MHYLDPETPSYLDTTAIRKIYQLRKRIRGIPGGTSAGKTYGIIPWLIDRAIKYPRREISVVSESFPHLRKGAMKDFLKIMADLKRFNPESFNKGTSTYTFSNGSYMEFFSANDAGKVHGPRRNDLYINEANRISWDTYHAMFIRTDGLVILDFNPTRKFWYHDNVIGDPDWQELILTYKDNEALSPILVKEIEKALTKGYHDPSGNIFDQQNIKNEYWANWWKVYGLGLIGSMEGQIFPDCIHVQEIPRGPYVYGLDWGYTHDPTAVVRLKYHMGTLYREQIYYKPNLDIDDLSDSLMLAGVNDVDPIICDNDPISVELLKKKGFNAYIAHKPAGSVLGGIQALKQIPIATTYDSDDLIKEEDMYFWEMKDGKPTDQPIDDFNHGWDGTRYGYDYILNPTKNYYLAQRIKAGPKTRKLFIGNM